MLGIGARLSDNSTVNPVCVDPSTGGPIVCACCAMCHDRILNLDDTLAAMPSDNKVNDLNAELPMDEFDKVRGCVCGCAYASCEACVQAAWCSMQCVLLCEGCMPVCLVCAPAWQERFSSMFLSFFSSFFSPGCRRRNCLLQAAASRSTGWAAGKR